MDDDMNKTEIPLDPARRWEWIKYQLRTSGTSLAKLARELGVSGAAVKNVKRTAYPRMERAIAKALGLQPADIWPERWNLNGGPCRLRPRRAERNATYSQDHTPHYDLRHCKTVARA
ncbi:helix-turn-helix domain-containing protein [Pseudomonas chlororaphis]|uniref:helix-turn-helix domain-containing protein n=1 Tax=Pseudomonas chlororaphis TaxID=587753 RepID=UPI001F151E02|nr:helix-turn-helix domain-containing protein [Pseudomonas chlororaphis]